MFNQLIERYRDESYLNALDKGFHDEDIYFR